LAGIAIFPYHPGAFIWRAHAQLVDFSSKFLDREPAGLDRLFQKTEQFALQRPMMSHRPAAKLCDDSIRDTLNRKIDWHSLPSLNTVPLRRYYGTDGLCVYPGNFGELASIAETKIGNVTPK